MAAFATRAAITAAAGLTNGEVYRVREVRADYTYNSGSSATVDGWTVLAATGMGSVGRILLDDDKIYLPAIGGTSDDWPNMSALTQAAAAATIAGLSPEVRTFPNTTYNAKTRQKIVWTNGRLKFHPTTTIVQAITDVDNRDSAILGYGTITLVDELAADTEIGQKTVVVLGATVFTPGQRIVIAIRQFRAAQYKVIAFNAGTKTITLDRPLKIPYGASLNVASFPDGAQVFTVGSDGPENFVVDLNGCTIKGAGNRFVEIYCGWNGMVFGNHAKLGDGTATTASERLMSWDETCFNCHAFDIHGDGGSTTSLGFTFESTENCSYNRCFVRKTDTGFWFQDAQHSQIIDCVGDDNLVWGAGVGAAEAGSEVALPTGSGSDWGSNRCSIVRGSFCGNGQMGIVVADGSTHTVIDGPLVMGNASYGIYDLLAYDTLITGRTKVQNNDSGIVIWSTSTRATIDKVDVYDNTLHGIYVETSAAKTRIGRVTAAGNGTRDLTLNAEAILDDVRCYGDTVDTDPRILIASTAVVRARQLNVLQVASPGASVSVFGTLNLESGQIVSAAGGMGIKAEGAAVVYLGQGVEITGHGSGGYGVKLEGSSVARVAGGATIDNRSVYTDTAANRTTTLVTDIGSPISRHAAT